MSGVRSRMREDWDHRAQDDAWYWVYTVHGRSNQDMTSYYEAGRRHALELTSLGLQHSGMDPMGKTLLEIGCGVGRLFPGFAEIGFRPIVGIDISPEMIELGRRNCPPQDARFLLTDGTSFDEVGSETVDFCFSYNVFQHFPDTNTLWQNMKEVHRVLKPAGCFQIHFRGGYSPRQRMLRALPAPFRRPAHILYRIASLKWLRGQSVRPPTDQDPGREETWELGTAVAPKRLTERLAKLGFENVSVVLDQDYADKRRYWALGQKQRAPDVSGSIHPGAGNR